MVIIYTIDIQNCFDYFFPFLLTVQNENLGSDYSFLSIFYMVLVLSTTGSKEGKGQKLCLYFDFPL